MSERAPKRRRVPAVASSSTEDAETVLADECLAWVLEHLVALADPSSASAQQKYLKTDMPMYGLKAAVRRNIGKQAAKKFPISTQKAFEAVMHRLWDHSHREAKYVAIHVARLNTDFLVSESLPIFEKVQRMILWITCATNSPTLLALNQFVREGAWWDLVDEIAIHLVGDALRSDPEAVWPVIDKWISDDCMWIRRTAILCQNRSKQDTDEARLFRYCLACVEEKEFFIRKAIGWALRDYARTKPEALREFANENKDKLSVLSLREACKHIGMV